MKILMSGGVKTQNIVDGIAKKFESSNDEFTVVQFLDNINEIYSKGDYYDKALITEQSITRENSITDEYEIRNRINQFAVECAQRGNKQSFVFLTQQEYLANIIYEEILPIERNSAIVLAKPKYSVSFFHTILVNDVNQIPSEYIFKPQAIQNTFEEVSVNEEADMEDFDVNESMNIQQATDASDIFGNTEDVWGGTTISDEVSLGYDNEDEGESVWGSEESDGFNTDGDGFFDNEEQSTEDIWGNIEENTDWSTEENFGEAIENTEDANSFSEYVNNEEPEQKKVSLFKNDNDTVINDDIQPIKQSGDIPNYEIPVENNGISLEKKDESYEMNNDFNNMEQFIEEDTTQSSDINTLDDAGFGDSDYANDINGNLPGWDVEETSQSSFSDELYAGFTPSDIFDDDMYNDEPEVIEEQLNNSGITMSNTLEGFDEDDYSNQTNDGFTSENQGIPNNTSMEFDEDDYNPNNNTSNQLNDESMQNTDMSQFNNSQMNPAMMAAGAMAGMGVVANEVNEQARANKQPKSKIKSLFGKGNQQQNTQTNMNVQANTEATTQKAPVANQHAPKVNVNAIKSKLQPFANKGNSIVVTGCGGCGTSTVAYSIANILCQLGYSVLLVDMDTEGRTQSYITKTNYESMDSESANLMSAINSSTGIGNYTSVVKEGFHLLTMGLGTDTAPVNELIHKEKISRFVNVAKTSYNFIIYDIPFNTATSFLSEIVYMADNVVLVTDASNWGITKTMLNMCNIASDEMQDTMFHRAQLVFNKYRRLHKVFGKKVKTATDITNIMDEKVFELIGEDIGLYFNRMTISGIINDVPEIEDGWFSDVQYSDTAKGQHVFLKLIEDIILNR